MNIADKNIRLAMVLDKALVSKPNLAEAIKKDNQQPCKCKEKNKTVDSKPSEICSPSCSCKNINKNVKK